VRERLGARLLAAGACAVAAGGCGSDDPAQPERKGAPAETVDRRGPLPPGWKRVVNRRAGFSVGIPPGWTVRGAVGTTLVRSGDRLMAVSISADRSTEGRELSPRTYVVRTARLLRGYRLLRVRGRPRRVGSRYRNAAVQVTGRFARTRVRQSIRVVALQRPGRVTYALLFFRTAGAPAALYEPAVAGMVRTFRAQPPA
jgi:hypothetical protein